MPRYVNVLIVLKFDFQPVVVVGVVGVVAAFAAVSIAAALHVVVVSPQNWFPGGTPVVEGLLDWLSAATQQTPAPSRALMTTNEPVTLSTDMAFFPLYVSAAVAE
jgi:hypothetical protein